MESTTGSSKYDIARALIAQASIYVHLDPRRDEVLVPEMFLEQPQLVLQFGHDMPTPIPDLEVDERGVRGTLAFNRLSFFCDVPWECVFAIVGEAGEGMVWPADIPEEIAREIERWSRAREPEGRPAGADNAPSGTEGRRTASPGAARQRAPLHSAERAPSPVRAVQPLQPLSVSGRDDAASGDASVHAEGADAKRPAAQLRAAKKPLPSYLRVVK